MNQVVEAANLIKKKYEKIDVLLTTTPSSNVSCETLFLAINICDSPKIDTFGAGLLVI